MTTQSQPANAEEISPFSLFSTFFPYAVGIIVFISATRQFLVFKEFNLPIFNFLELSDLTTKIVNDLYGLYLFFILSLVLMVLKDSIKKIVSRKGFYWSAGIFAVLLAIVGYTYWADKITTRTIHFWTTIVMFAGLCIGAFSYKSLLTDPPRGLKFVGSVNNKTLILSLILVFSYLFCKSLASYEIYDLKCAKSSKGTVITFKEQDGKRKLISNDSVYYIGNTTKYVFVYNQGSNKCTSYPMESIASIETVK